MCSTGITVCCSKHVDHCTVLQVEGQTESFLQHMRLGVGAAAKDPEALLMFSGGQTRAPAGPRSEAASYWGVTDAALWFGKPEVRKRTVLEVRSTADRTMELLLVLPPLPSHSSLSVQHSHRRSCAPSRLQTILHVWRKSRL